MIILDFIPYSQFRIHFRVKSKLLELLLDTENAMMKIRDIVQIVLFIHIQINYKQSEGN